MLLAERDRLYVKRCKVVFQIVLIQVIQILQSHSPTYVFTHFVHLQDNREWEADLMKGVEGWEVGTYFGVPLYKDVKNKYPITPWEEYYVHCRPQPIIAEIKHREYHVT